MMYIYFDFILFIFVGITHGKYWYPVGESVKCYCETTNGSSSDLFLSDMLSNFPLNETGLNYTVEVVNKSTILLQFYNVSVGKYNYVCRNAKKEKTLSNIGVVSFEVGCK